MVRELAPTEHSCSEPTLSSEKTHQIPLTKGFFAVVDSDDFDFLDCRRWYARVVRGGTHVYAACSVGTMHGFLMRPPTGMVVDHINGNTLDNRRSNLRICTAYQNRCNRILRRDARVKYKGVVWNCGSYKAQITVNRKVIYLGRFQSELDAASAYDAAAREHFGEFARTNFGKDSACLAVAS